MGVPTSDDLLEGPVPLLPASLTEPLWVEFAALIGTDERPEFSPTHPWGCHRRRVPDRTVFDHVIAALVHGSGYERLASPGRSDRTQGTKRSLAADGDGIPLHLVAARANDHASPLLEPTLAGICDMIGPLPDLPCMHLDRGYDSGLDPGPAGDPRLRRRHRVQGRAGTDPGREALAGGAHPLLDERATASCAGSPTNAR